MIAFARSAAALFAVSLLFALTGCTGSGGSVGGLVGFQGATVRFLNGSPDTGAVDVAVGTPSNKLFVNVGYGQLSAYANYTATNTPDVFVYKAGTSTLVAGRVLNDGQTGTATLTFGPKSRDTMTLVGYNGAGNVGLVNFQEHIFNTGAGFGATQFHHAAVGLIGTTVDYGYFSCTSSSCNPASRTTIGSAQYGLAPIFMEPLPQNITSAGIAFEVLGGARVIRPVDVDATDTTNVMPINGATQNNDQNLSVYMIDSSAIGSGGYQLVGVFDPDN